MDNLKIYRHMIVIDDNIKLMIMHRDYAIRQLKYMLEELVNTDEYEMWKKYLDLVESLDLPFRELSENVEVEKQKQKYKDQLFQND